VLWQGWSIEKMKHPAAPRRPPFCRRMDQQRPQHNDTAPLDHTGHFACRSRGPESLARQSPRHVGAGDDFQRSGIRRVVVELQGREPECSGPDAASPTQRALDCLRTGRKQRRNQRIIGQQSSERRNDGRIVNPSRRNPDPVRPPLGGESTSRTRRYRTLESGQPNELVKQPHNAGKAQ
jgi:hypothetical protein